MTPLSVFHSFIVPERSSKLDSERCAGGTEEKVNKPSWGRFCRESDT